jgi:hypothetical protein
MAAILKEQDNTDISATRLSTLEPTQVLTTPTTIYSLMRHEEELLKFDMDSEFRK